MRLLGSRRGSWAQAQQGSSGEQPNVSWSRSPRISPPLPIRVAKLSRATHPPTPENASLSLVYSGSSFGHDQTGGRGPPPQASGPSV